MGFKAGSSLVVPPPPYPLAFETRGWRGVYKLCLQNLEPQGLEVKILKTKDLAMAARGSAHGDAGRYHASLEIVKQGQMSQD